MATFTIFRTVEVESAAELAAMLKPGELAAPEFAVPAPAARPSTNGRASAKQSPPAAKAPAPGMPLTASLTAEMQELRNQGMTLASIGERYGVSGTRVAQILKYGGARNQKEAIARRKQPTRRWSRASKRRAELRRQSRQVATPELAAEMLALREQGHTIKELCRAYNYSSGHVTRLLQQAEANAKKATTEVA